LGFVAKAAVVARRYGRYGRLEQVERVRELSTDSRWILGVFTYALPRGGCQRRLGRTGGFSV